MEVPVYLFTGFLESGKTGFINHTIQDENFSRGEKSLVLLCEEGIDEIEDSVQKKYNTEVVVVEDEDDLTEEFIHQCNIKYKPERVFIEYNGMWDTKKFMDLKLPKGWELVQIITLINAETYEAYMSNMRSILVNHYTESDMVIFNRCNMDMDRGSFRRSVKAVNRKAQIYFEGEGIDPQDAAEQLPFDLDAEVIEIEDDDFGIWYMDAMENPKKYAGKTVHFTGRIYKNSKLKKNEFVPGRHAMTCCEDDITYIGFICKGQEAEILEHKQWATITAEVRVEFRKEYRGKGPVLYAKKVSAGIVPEEELVYFY